MHLAHVNDEFLLDSFGVVNLEVVEELVRHRDKRLLGPGEEPVDIASGEDAREFLGTHSKLHTDWGEAKHGVEAILHTVDEVDPEFLG